MARILVIDDSKVQRTYVRLVCEDAGHQVAEAGDGAEGIAASGDCDLILLDLQLPDMTGQEVLQQLSAAGVTVPVIVLSADDPQQVREQCLALGATRAELKPDDPRELLSMLEQELAR